MRELDSGWASRVRRRHAYAALAAVAVVCRRCATGQPNEPGFTPAGAPRILHLLHIKHHIKYKLNNWKALHDATFDVDVCVCYADNAVVCVCVCVWVWVSVCVGMCARVCVCV